MLYKTLSAAVYGIDANIIQVEGRTAPASSAIRTTSTPSACPTPQSAKAATASAPRSKNCGYDIPPTHITYQRHHRPRHQPRPDRRMEAC